MPRELAYALIPVGLAVLFLLGAAFAFWEASAPWRDEARAVLTIWRVRRQNQRILIEEARRVAGLKAEILAIGSAEVDPWGGLLLSGWSFDVSNGTPVHRVDERGVWHYCGYTKQELLEIHARPDEFVPLRHRAR